MFDYIAAEGSGLDTQAAVRERREVLEFIQQHFTVVRGVIPAGEGNVRAVICQKK